MTSRRRIANALIFQAGWFACVLGGSGWAGVVTPLILLVHWRWLAQPGEWRWWLAFALIGAVVDGSLIAAGGLVIEDDGSSFWPPFLPSPWLFPSLWLWALWPLFATTLHHCLAWLWPHRALAILFGAVGGPLSYVSGAALASVEIQPWAIGVEAVVWGLLCGWVAWRLGGTQGTRHRRPAE